MTTKELLAVVERRKLKLALENGQPVIQGDRKLITGELLAVLKIHRQWIIDLLSKKHREEMVP